MQLPQPLRSLKKPQTLLLLGGAFGFVALAVWFGVSFRLVRDHLDRPPREAVAGFYLEGAWPKALVAALPDHVQAILASSFPNGPKDAVVYASLDNNGRLTWAARWAEDGGWKLVPRSAAGYGFVVNNGQKLPIELTLSQSWIAARIGQGFRGPDLDASRPIQRMLKTMPDGAYLYVLDRNASQSVKSLPAELIGQNLNISNSWTNLYESLGDQVETIVAHHDDPNAAFQPFLMAAEPSTQRQMPQVNKAIASLIGEVTPQSSNIVLPDKTPTIELKSGRLQVVANQKKSALGVVTRYGSPEKPELLTSFEDQSGHFWISDSAVAIQGFIMAGADSSLKFPTACAPLTPTFQAVYYPDRDSASNTQTQWIKSWAGSMKKAVFSLNEAETGLFTICGYYL
jgi:hypothetical protein